MSVFLEIVGVLVVLGVLYLGGLQVYKFVKARTSK